MRSNPKVINLKQTLNPTTRPSPASLQLQPSYGTAEEKLRGAPSQVVEGLGFYAFWVLAGKVWGF